MDPAAIAYAEKALADGAKPTKVQMRLLKEYDLNVKPKTLQNMKQKINNSIAFYHTKYYLFLEFYCIRNGSR